MMDLLHHQVLGETYKIGVYQEECKDNAKRSEGTESGRRICIGRKFSWELFQKQPLYQFFKHLTPAFSHRKES